MLHVAVVLSLKFCAGNTLACNSPLALFFGFAGEYARHAEVTTVTLACKSLLALFCGLRGKTFAFNWPLALIWLFASYWFKCRSIFSVLKSQTLNTSFLVLQFLVFFVLPFFLAFLRCVPLDQRKCKAKLEYLKRTFQVNGYK